MAKGGKHLNTQPHRGSSARHGHTRRRSRSGRLRTGAPQMLIMLLLCLFMISPLRGCILYDGDFIGYNAAQEIAFGDAGISQDKANNISMEMIKLDGQMCYKVQFSGSVTDYRYIIDADSGDILAQVFYRSGETGN